MLLARRLVLSRPQEAFSRGYRHWKQSACHLSSARSSSSSAADDDRDKTPANGSGATATQVKVWRDWIGKGVGQVLFLNSPTAGGILVAGLAVGDPYLAGLAVTGTMASTATAYAVVGRERHQDALNAGLLAYNGCLIGCAAGGFLLPQVGIASSALWTLVLAPTSTLVSLALPKVTGSVPQWTWAFNAVALSQLLHIQPLATASEAAAVVLSPSAAALAVSPAVGLSQIFVVNSAYTGIGIAAAIASYSPLLTVHAVMGSTLGCLTGAALLGAGPDTVAMGLWGYNAALTSMAVGVFYQNTRAAWMLSAGGAVATAGLHGGLAAAFGALGTPCLTLPFCIMATGCHLLADTLPGLRLAASPHSPEKNTPVEAEEKDGEK